MTVSSCGGLSCYRCLFQCVEAGQQPRYDGRCRELTPEEISERLIQAEKNDSSFTLRFRYVVLPVSLIGTSSILLVYEERLYRSAVVLVTSEVSSSVV